MDYNAALKEKVLKDEILWKDYGKGLYRSNTVCAIKCYAIKCYDIEVIPENLVEWNARIGGWCEPYIEENDSILIDK